MNGQCLGSVTMQNLYSRLAPWLLTLIEAFLLIAAGGLILFSSRRSSRNDQPAVVRTISVLACAMILRVTAAAVHIRIEPAWPRRNLERAAIARQLQQLPGQPLVTVHYRPHPNARLAWVYNKADIEASKVVWARDMGRHDNQELLDYFNNRQVWQVNAIDFPPRLESYEAAQK